MKLRNKERAIVVGLLAERGGQLGQAALLQHLRRRGLAKHQHVLTLIEALESEGAIKKTGATTRPIWILPEPASATPAEAEALALAADRQAAEAVAEAAEALARSIPRRNPRQARQERRAAARAAMRTRGRVEASARPLAALAAAEAEILARKAAEAEALARRAPRPWPLDPYMTDWPMPVEAEPPSYRGYIPWDAKSVKFLYITRIDGGYFVQVRRRGLARRKVFSDAKHGDRLAALGAAIDWRNLAMRELARAGASGKA